MNPPKASRCVSCPHLIHNGLCLADADCGCRDGPPRRRPRRFYVASAFDLVREVQRVCDALEARGHVVAVKWWNLEGEAHKAKTAPIAEAEFYGSDAVQATAARDFGGVATCDALILVTDGPARKFNGAMIEMGYGLAHGKPCYALGQLDRSAMFAHVRHGMALEEIVAEVESE